jgi:hypothetical protein
MNTPLEPAHVQFGGRGVARTLPFASSTAHHLFGASQARTRIGCPASAREIEKLPADMLGKTSSWAERGTACHIAVARLIENKCTLGDLIGTTIGSHTLTCDDCEEAIRPAFEYAVAFLDTPGAEYFLEQRVSFPTIPGAFGTADLIIRIGDTIRIIDFKFGTGVLVRALYPDGDEDIVNSQILFYAVAAHHSLPDFFRGVEHIILEIVQPQAIDAEMVSAAEVTRAELDEFAAFYAAIYAEAMGPSPRLRKGPHCRFCPVRPVCPEHTKPLLDLAQFVMPLPTAEDYYRALGAGLDLVDAVKEISTALRDQAKQALDAGHAVPGYALTEGRVVRSWQDEAAVAPALLRLGLMRDDVIEETLRSPAQIEKRARARGLKVPSEFIVSTRSGTSLARVENVRVPVRGRGELARSFAAALEAFQHNKEHDHDC